ncbi:transglutaminase domain-containing protein [Paenibacillus sp. UMB4589-SE434]|uniref:transglutaminase family protein n=1 Tax=Paenibacillus sp. UMB4589-SE434 TaxID=3046314 RepID=UPI002549D8BE|nr:transglutaminase domain-containing protein [Paenibacillus sp. UMB4589-SE434]MDK8182670.1 transglutaminase domain-containing protein [Paenibacillus sp. UMB4589-SE434]
MQPHLIKQVYASTKLYVEPYGKDTMERNGVQLWQQVTCTVLLFGLFMEWLIPLQYYGGKEILLHVLPIVCTIVGSLLAGVFLTRRVLLLVIVRAGIAVLSSAWVLGAAAESRQADLTGMSGDFIHNVSAVSHGFARLYTGIAVDMQQLGAGLIQWQWAPIGEELQTLLLIVGIVILCALIQSLMLTQHSILLFSGATLAYLVILQMVLGADNAYGFVRTIAWTAALASCLQLQRQKRWDRTYTNMAWPVRWWLATVLFSTGLVALFALWGQAAQWDKPKSWPALTSWVQEAADTAAQAIRETAGRTKEGPAGLAGGPARTGYGTDDTELGAPVSDDAAILFRASTPAPTYWRVESKSIYTGRGWEVPDEEAALSPEVLDPSGAISSEAADKQAAKLGWSRPITQTIQLEASEALRMPLVFGGRPERLQSWESDHTSDYTQGQYYDAGKRLPKLKYEQAWERYRAVGGDQTDEFSLSIPLRYSYETRIFQMDGEKWSQLEDIADPSEITAKYTSLPQSTPDRVRKLANEILSPAAARYEQVKRVQHYLLSHYAYTKAETAVPPIGTDFVDQFLFEQRQGYCNHFSTAMAVLLRAEGIPARWVKGFAPGQVEAPGQYVVQASAAHSWVEVYFPQVGWVAFEATPPSGVQSTIKLDSSQAAGTERAGGTARTAESLTSNANQASTMRLKAADHVEGTRQLGITPRRTNMVHTADTATTPRVSTAMDTDVVQAPIDGEWLRLAAEHKVLPLKERSASNSLASSDGSWGHIWSSFWDDTVQQFQRWRKAAAWGVDIMSQQASMEWARITSGAYWQGILTDEQAGQEGSTKRGTIIGQLWDEIPMMGSLLFIFILLALLLSIRYFARMLRYNAPLRQLKRLVSSQQQYYDAERVPLMGKLAWQLIERRCGHRPNGMTLDEYLEGVSQLSLHKDTVQLLQLFAKDCNAMLYAKYQGERIHRTRFVDGCAGVLEWLRADKKQSRSQ